MSYLELSYAAAQTGAILTNEDGFPMEAEVYRDLLRGILGEIELSASEHPKLREAITDAVNAADRGEKTLIFCSRIATLTARVGNGCEKRSTPRCIR